MTWAQEVLFPANPDLADMLDDMDSNLGMLSFEILFHSELPNPGSPTSRNRAWAGPGLGLGPRVGWPSEKRQKQSANTALSAHGETHKTNAKKVSRFVLSY